MKRKVAEFECKNIGDLRAAAKQAIEHYDANRGGDAIYPADGILKLNILEDTMSDGSKVHDFEVVVKADKPERPAPKENRIIEVKISLDEGGHEGVNWWKIEVRKEFEEQYGGGEQTFTEYAPTMWRAIEEARGMVTMHPARRTE